jgi:hypothetical protein
MHKKNLDMRGPALKCKQHKQDSISFCTNHLLFICGVCFQEHPHNRCQMAKGTNKTIKSLLNKALEVLINRQEKLGNEVDKIREMLKINEYDHEKVLEVFKILNDFTKELLIDPETIDFLTPYILKV